MYTDYLETFREALGKCSPTAQPIHDQELRYIARFVDANPLLGELSMHVPQNLADLPPRYVLKYLLCARLDSAEHPRTFEEFHEWAMQSLNELTQSPHIDVDQINSIFEYSNVESFTRRFNSYVEQLAKACLKSSQGVPTAHLRVLKITLLQVKQQVDRGSSEELDNFLFSMLYSEISIDLDFLMGNTDVISNRLDKFKAMQAKEV